MGARTVDSRAAHGPATRRWVALVALAASYVVLGRLGLLLAENQANATLVWAPTGLSIAALVLAGPRLWPAVFAGALAVNLWIGTPLAAALGIASGNTLEAVVGAFLLTRVGRLAPEFDRLRDVLVFVLLGAVASTVVSATCGVGSLLWADRVAWPQAPTVWLDWWLGDAGGAIVVAPAILVWARGEPALGSLARRAETWLVVGLLAAVTVAGFGGVVATEWRLLTALLIFPLLVWAGLRLGPRGAISASAGVSIIAVIGGSQGGGPFVGDVSLYLTLAYIATTGMVGVILAAAVAERRTAERLRRVSDDARKRLELQASERERLEELGMLAGGVAHDFNNLLVPILANAELLDRDHVSPAERRRRLGDIGTAARRAGELCHQLMTYAGRARPALEPVDLGGLTREMRQLLATSTARGVTLAAELDERVVVLGDPSQLRQLALNLILNAAEACQQRGGKVTVRVAIEDVSADELAHDELATGLAAGRYAVFEVADDGVGIEREALARIFRPFYSTKFTGRGLGLAAALGVVRAHGGAITVASEPGEGTCFRAFLPLHGEEAVVRDESIPRTRPSAGAVALVADDDELVLRAVVTVLELAGIEVVTASNGREAVEAASQHGDTIDLVILDVLMPELDGREALAVIRDRRPEIPAILISGYTAEHVDHGTDEQTRFLPKPFTPDELQDLVAAIGSVGNRAARA
jgi:signal transduction histidine kinase/CheY-like chemotaxis protein